jgi:hypothetical protein
MLLEGDALMTDKCSTKLMILFLVHCQGTVEIIVEGADFYINCWNQMCDEED